jgi:hypothetical protein
MEEGGVTAAGHPNLVIFVDIESVYELDRAVWKRFGQLYPQLPNIDFERRSFPLLHENYNGKKAVEKVLAIYQNVSTSVFTPLLSSC